MAETALEDPEFREGFPINRGGILLADHDIQIPQAALDIAGCSIEFGAVTQKHFAFGVFQHSVSDVDLIPVAVGCDAVSRQGTGGEEGKIRIDIQKNLMGIFSDHAGPGGAAQLSAGHMDMEIRLRKQERDLKVIGHNRQISFFRQSLRKVITGGGLIQKNDAAVRDHSGGFLGDVPLGGSVHENTAAEGAGIRESLEQFRAPVGSVDKPFARKGGKGAAYCGFTQIQLLTQVVNGSRAVCLKNFQNLSVSFCVL